MTAIAYRDGTVRLEGELRMADAASIWRGLKAAVRVAREQVTIDMTAVTMIDGAIMSLLVAARAELAARGVRSTLTGASDRLQPLVHLYGADEPARAEPPPPSDGTIAGLGRATAALGVRMKHAIAFIGEIASSAVRVISHPRIGNWRTLPALTERAGIDGVPIVLLLNFLVGFVMAFQSARQLQLYGANIFVADVVGISATRELVPLMTAIIMSGRSGAAYAAEIGTMRVSEEIDALRTMGFAPAVFLVMPRVIALAIVAPALTLLGDVVAVLGGGVVAQSWLDVSLRGYIAELRTAVLLADIWTGLLKSFAFGIAIAFIGCQQGFVTRGAAAGVGRGTTATVVLCLFTIVIIDTVFTLIFRTFNT